jgi:hypothetical protein
MAIAQLTVKLKDSKASILWDNTSGVDLLLIVCGPPSVLFPSLSLLVLNPFPFSSPYSFLMASRRITRDNFLKYRRTSMSFYAFSTQKLKLGCTTFMREKMCGVSLTRVSSGLACQTERQCDDIHRITRIRMGLSTIAEPHTIKVAIQTTRD